MIAETFERIFGYSPSAVQFTPARVNLIGSHTDYNGGMVLPTALSIGVSVALAAREDNEIHIHSTRFHETAVYRLEDAPNDLWADYAAGAVQAANQAGFLSGGADVLINTTMPDGAGLSSSAALIVCILKAARSISSKIVSNTEIAILARRVENDYIGMPCGIMDQMAVAVARPDKAMALNTQTLDYKLIAIPEKLRICVIHTGVQRNLSDGRYKARALECEQAARSLSVEYLCKMSLELCKKADALPEPLNKRARHLYTDHRRVLSAADALEQADIAGLGRLIYECHVSLRDDFEISLPGIDALVEDAVGLGALGARLTGGGFGGCIVACIERENYHDWIDALLERHPQARLIC